MDWSSELVDRGLELEARIGADQSSELVDRSGSELGASESWIGAD